MSDPVKAAADAIQAFKRAATPAGRAVALQALQQAVIGLDREVTRTLPKPQCFSDNGHDACEYPDRCTHTCVLRYLEI